jgi:hypothetical protein
VREYFRAINNHRFHRAWSLGGKNSSGTFSAFLKGYAGTAHDSVQILSASGNFVTARVTAVQTDGRVKVFEGTYIVIGGEIAQSDIKRIS